MANYYEAYDDGHVDGAREGFKSGAAEGYTKGHAEGAQSGYAKGYEEGYAAGGGGSSSEWKYKTKIVMGYGGSSAGSFPDGASVLYAPNAEGNLGTGQFAAMSFDTTGGIVLDFPKAGPVIGTRCFSGMMTNGDAATVSSGNFPEVQAVGAGAFADNRTVTADFPKCRDVGIDAFRMQDEDSGQHSVSGNLSFAAVTPLWACFPAMSGSDSSGDPYHVGPMKVPIIPVILPETGGGEVLPGSATRNVDFATSWHWGAPGSGACEISTDITWSGASCGTGFYMAKTDAGSVDDSGVQNGVFGYVTYRVEDDIWTHEVHESKFNISLPGIPVDAVANTQAFQDAYASPELPRPEEDTPDLGLFMHIFGLAYGSTIACSDGVYTVK